MGCGGDIRNMGEERDWEKIKGRLPGRFEWGAQWASRKSKRGRNMGGC